MYERDGSVVARVVFDVRQAAANGRDIETVLEQVAEVTDGRRAVAEAALDLARLEGLSTDPVQERTVELLAGVLRSGVLR